MRTKHLITRAGALCCVLALGVAAAPSAAAHGGGHGHGSSKVRVLAEGLSSPKGIATDARGNPIVAQGAFGPPGPVLLFPQLGPDRGDAIPVTDPVGLLDVAISPKDGTGWGIGPGEDEHVFLYHQLEDGTVVTVLDITAYQVTDPDPVDQEGVPDESNPYGLTIDRHGNALVADAAGNDVIKVTPGGEATTIARFDVETVKTDHLPPEELGELPPALSAEAVPTTVTVGPDGAIYVGELKGFPFRPGSSRVWRIDPRADGVLCSVNTPSRGCRTYARGLTAIQDIAFGPKDHKLYVLELAEDGVLAFEAGFETGEFPPAVLLKVGRHGRSEVAEGQLSQPGGIAFSPRGKLYATDGVFGNGRLLRIG